MAKKQPSRDVVGDVSMGGNAKQRLKSFAERIERLSDEQTAIAADMKEVYQEAKGEGFDAKILKQAIALGRLDRKLREERRALLDLYCEALGV